MARNANMKYSGTGLEVLGSRLVEGCGVEAGGEMGVKGHCYVHKNLLGRSRGRPLGTFLCIYLIFDLFDPNLARSPLNLLLANLLNI